MTLPLLSSSGVSLSGDADVDSIARVLVTTLDAIVLTFERANVDLPARRYVHFGGTAADCEQLTVQLDQTYLGTPGGDPNALQRCNGPRTCAMSVQLWRTAPSLGAKGQPPSALSLSEAAVSSSRDAWLLLDSLNQIDVDAGWGTGVIAEVSALPPQGNFRGLTMSLVVPVP